MKTNWNMLIELEKKAKEVKIDLNDKNLSNSLLPLILNVFKVEKRSKLDLENCIDFLSFFYDKPIRDNSYIEKLSLTTASFLYSELIKRDKKEELQKRSIKY